MLKKIETKEDINLLVDKFYQKVRADELIGPIFDEQAKVDWQHHLPKIANFWSDLLLGSDEYRGRPFPPHINFNLKVEHFERWLGLFYKTVDEHFEGQKAEEVKARALNIGRNFLTNLKALGQEI